MRVQEPLHTRLELRLRLLGVPVRVRPALLAFERGPRCQTLCRP